MNKKPIYYSVDRIEDGFIFLLDEEDNLQKIQQNIITFTVQEGDILAFENNTFLLDKEKTELEKQKTQHLLQKLLNKKQP